MSTEETAVWTGCGDCDCSFRCHNGETRCIRMPLDEFLCPAKNMFLLDYFAAEAMTVLIPEVDGPDDDCPGAPRYTQEQVAILAYDQAEAMLAEREKRK